jgi:hypothetical protein
MRVSALLPLVFLAGCAIENMQLGHAPPGGSSAWRQGYSDGCQSGLLEGRGHSREAHLVDRERQRSTDEYRDGWKQGHEECLARARADAATPAWGEIPTPTPTLPAAAAVEATPSVIEPHSAEAAEPADAARREEIQRRLRELRDEGEVLERELEQLPR